MLLEQGQSGAALAQFQRYLAASGGRNLSAEALYGKGRSLAQLGRITEEQSTWRTLLKQFPKSPYVSHAQKRLGLAK
jgi:TolA-binding protein